MKRGTGILIMIAVLPLAVRASAARPARATLTIAPGSTLPGLSVPLSLQIRTGSQPIHLAEQVRIRVTPPAGEPFIVGWGELDMGLIDLYPRDGEPIVLEPNATYPVTIPAVDLSRPSWALDPRLLGTPGVYSFEVLLYDTRGEPTDQPRVPAVVSAPATLRIDAPDARDADIWQAIQRREHWAIAAAVAAGRTHSPYFPYFAPLASLQLGQYTAEPMLNAIKLHPGSPVVPWLHTVVANFYSKAAQEVFDVQGDLEGAVKLSDRARAVLEQLERLPGPWAKARAKRDLEQLPGRAYFLDLERIHKNNVQ